MSEVNSICPKPDWQQLVQEMARDNGQIKALLNRLITDSATQYTADMQTIAGLETDEYTTCNELSSEVSKTSDPTQSRADLTQLETDLNSQKANLSEINHFHSIDPSQFEYYCDAGKALCDYNISPDINQLRQDA
jgi:hypothetical protein